MTRCDALIVGGGPAGLASAIALRQKGLDVLVADALRPPIDKACGEGLMPPRSTALPSSLNATRPKRTFHTVSGSASVACISTRFWLSVASN
jgi:anaerobic glycerol-3-phosphate dehydrogenase